MTASHRFKLDGVHTADDAAIVLREYVHVLFTNSVKEQKAGADTTLSLTGDEEARVQALVVQLFELLGPVESARLYRRALEILQSWPESYAGDKVVTTSERYDTMAIRRITAGVREVFQRTLEGAQG
ncbi:MAG: hypothetical protein ABIJ09_00080 [Pseudomonadota bacterium]